MSIAALATSTASRTLIPWAIAVGVTVLIAVGTGGMYLGYEIASARYANDKQALIDAQLSAMDAKNQALLEAIKRGDTVSNEFLVALKDMKVVNTTIMQEVRRETEKLVYTDCKLPDSGADLLKKNADSVNLRLLGKEVKK